MKKGNVLIMAGGTGGHVIPALSVAKELKVKGYQVHWLGSVQGIENDLVPDAGYPLHRITISGLRGNGLVKKLLAPFQLLKALWQTFKVFRMLKPKVAIGMGGFASGPGGLMALLLRVPLVIHEQNAIPGLTNSTLSKRATFLLQAFEGTFSALPSAKTVGNPVRQSIVDMPAPEERLANRLGDLNVLVVGGSLGAVAINDVLIEASQELTSAGINIWHQVGKRNYDAVKAGYASHGTTQVKVSDFIGNMADAYSWADVVLCRAGALTVSEIMSAGVASILVPYPYAVDDHQTANAQFLVGAKAGLLLPQNELSKEKLVTLLLELKSDRERVLAMSKSAKTLAKPDAAKTVTHYCIEALHGR